MPTLQEELADRALRPGFNPVEFAQRFQAKYGMHPAEADPRSPAQAPVRRTKVNPLTHAEPPAVPGAEELLAPVQSALASPQARNELESQQQQNAAVNRAIGVPVGLYGTLGGAASALGFLDAAEGGFPDRGGKAVLTMIPGRTAHPIQEQMNAVPTMVAERQKVTFPERLVEGTKALYGGFKQAIAQPVGLNIPQEIVNRPPSPENTWEMLKSSVRGGEQLVGGAVGLPLGMVRQEAQQPGSVLTNMPVEAAAILAPGIKGLGKLGRAAELRYGAEPGLQGAIARGAGAVADVAESPVRKAYGAVERAFESLPESATKTRLTEYVESMVNAGRMTADKGAQFLEKYAPSEYRILVDTPVQGTPSLLQRAVKTGANAAVGAALGGPIVGEVAGAAIGALLPEGLRAAWAKLPPERQAWIARNFGNNPTQQATPQETAIADVPYEVGKRARAIQEIGREAAGIVKADRPDIVPAPEPVIGPRGKPINDEYWQQTVHRPGTTVGEYELAGKEVRPSQAAGSRLVDVGKQAEDMRGLEQAAGIVKESIPETYKDLTEEAKAHVDRLRDIRSASWERLQDRLNMLREKRAEVRADRDVAYEDYKATQGRLGRGFERERDIRSKVYDEAQRQAGVFRENFELDKAENNAKLNAAKQEIEARKADVHAAFEDAIADAKDRHAEFEKELADTHDAITQQLKQERDLRTLLRTEPSFRSDPQFNQTVAAVERRIEEAKAKLKESADMQRYVRSENRAELRQISDQRRAELAGWLPEGDVSPEAQALRVARWKREGMLGRSEKILKDRNDALAAMRERKQTALDVLRISRELMLEHSKNAKENLSVALEEIERKHAPELEKLQRRLIAPQKAFERARQEHLEKVGELKSLREEKGRESEVASALKTMATRDLKERGLTTDEQMLGKSGLAVPQEPTRVPFTSTSERLEKFTPEAARFMNELGGLPSTDLPEKIVARLTTDPMLRDSLSILRSPRFVGLMLKDAPKGLKGPLTDFIYNEISQKALGDMPTSGKVTLPDGSVFDVGEARTKLWDALKKESPKELAEMQAEAIKANFKQASTLSVEQGVGNALLNEVDRFHTTETRGREGSLPAYSQNLVRRVLGQDEAAAQVLPYDPSHIAAQVTRLAEEQGLSPSKAAALSDTLQKQYEPLPADMRAVMNAQARAAGKPEVHGPVYIKKGYKEVLRAVGDAHGIFEQASEAQKLFNKVFFAAKKGVTALSLPVHMTNTLGNTMYRWMQDGTNPVEQAREMRTAYTDWKGFNDGSITDGQTARMMRSFAKSGYLHTGLLDFEADALGLSKSPAQGKLKQAWQHYEKGMTAAYSLGDSLFKIAQGEKNYRMLQDAFSRLALGRKITLDLGNDRMLDVTALGDGKFRAGKKVLRLDSPEMSDLIAVHALEKPTRWLLDYGQQPLALQATRRSLAPQALGAVNPFMSWGYGMLDLPWKKGAVRNMLDYDGSMFVTDDPKLLVESAKRAVSTAAKRAAFVGTAESNDEQLRKARKAGAASKRNPNPVAIAESTDNPLDVSVRYLDNGNPFGPFEAVLSFMLQLGAKSRLNRSELAKAVRGEQSVPVQDQTPEQRQASDLYLKSKGQRLFAMDDQLGKVNNIFFGVLKHAASTTPDDYGADAAALDVIKTFAGSTAALPLDALAQVPSLIDRTAQHGTRRMERDPVTDMHRIESLTKWWMRAALAQSSRNENPLKSNQATLREIRSAVEKDVLAPLKAKAEVAGQQGTKAQRAAAIEQWTRAIGVLNTYLAAYGVDALETPEKEENGQ